MYSKQRKLIIAMVICLVLFATGLTWLFQMRFAAGDVYPVYSSLRSDPLGTQVLFESFNAVNEGTARRNYRPLDQKSWRSGDTFLACGLSQNTAFMRPKAWQDFLDQIAVDGGRLVVTFRPAGRRSSDRCRECEDEEELSEDKESDAEDGDAADKDAVDPCKGRRSPAKPGEKGDDETLSDEPVWFGLMTELGLSVTETDVETLEDMAWISAGAPQWLPEAVPWRSPLEFELDNDAWQVIYRRNGAPVVVQRSWGHATIVFAADSYLLSNEALRSHREPLLLSWLLPLDRNLVFDEFHNGLVKQPGIAGLMRKYRLYGVLASVAVLVFLLMWQQASVFVPRPTGVDEAARQAAMGNETAEGWVSLMQQHIRPDRLIAVCYGAWRSSPAAERLPEARLAAVDRMIDQDGDIGSKQPVFRYRQICELIKQGKRP